MLLLGGGGGAGGGCCGGRGGIRTGVPARKRGCGSDDGDGKVGGGDGLSLLVCFFTPVAVFRGLTAEFSATLVVVLVPLSSSSAHSSLSTKNQNWSFSTST